MRRSGAWATPNRHCGITYDIRFLFFAPQPDNGDSSNNISLPLEGFPVDQWKAAVDLLGVQEWYSQAPPARSRDHSGGSQEALLCDDPDFLRQCW